MLPSLTSQDGFLLVKNKYICMHICRRGISPAAGLSHSVCPITVPWNPVSPVAGTWTYKPLQPHPHCSCWYRHPHPPVSLTHTQTPGCPQSWYLTAYSLLCRGAQVLTQLRAASWRSIYPLASRSLHLLDSSPRLIFDSHHRLTCTPMLTPITDAPDTRTHRHTWNRSPHWKIAEGGV